MLPVVIDKIKKYFLKKKFTDIYKNNKFGGKQSRSGEGSGLLQTQHISVAIPELLNKFSFRSMLDAPCGDLYWLAQIQLPIEKYIGIDIVEEIIAENSKKYADEHRSFAVMDLVSDTLPQSDIILCRDCLVHLSYSDAFSVIKNFKNSGSRYLLTTTFTKRSSNKELGRALWRPVNLEKPPFNFPRPIEVINEKCTEADGEFSDKSLALWLLGDLPEF